MPTIDSQVHAYERNHPGRPWAGTLQGPAEVTGDQMVAAMDAVGVDGAILVSPFSMYRYDASYALEVYARHPGRFGLVKPVDQLVHFRVAVAGVIALRAAGIVFVEHLVGIVETGLGDGEGERVILDEAMAPRRVKGGSQ